MQEHAKHMYIQEQMTIAYQAIKKAAMTNAARVPIASAVLIFFPH